MRPMPMPSVIEPLPVALQRAVAHVLVQAAAGRIGQHAAHRRAAATSGTRTRPAKRAAGAARGHEGIDAPAGLLPDLRARWCASARRGWRCCRTGWTRWRWAAAPARRRATFWYWFGIAVRHRRHLVHLGAQHLEQLVFLRRLVVRHHDDAAIAARVAHVRQADAGVAGGAFDDGAAGLAARRAASACAHDARARRDPSPSRPGS